MMIHYAVPAEVLQPAVPFELDTFDGSAWVSVVPFALEDLRFGKGLLRGRLGQWLAAPLRDHRFMHVRTYVRHGNERGIYFMTEWVSHRLAVQLGPALFGLPYCFGELDYRHDHAAGRLAGSVRGGCGGNIRGRYRYVYDAPVDEHADYRACEVGTLDAFLMERYVAYTRWGGLGLGRNALSRERVEADCAGNFRGGMFRVWHEPWPQVRVDVTVHDEGLLKLTGEWFEHATRVSANYSPGVDGVWIGRPRWV